MRLYPIPAWVDILALFFPSIEGWYVGRKIREDMDNHLTDDDPAPDA